MRCSALGGQPYQRACAPVSRRTKPRRNRPIALASMAPMISGGRAAAGAQCTGGFLYTGGAMTHSCFSGGTTSLLGLAALVLAMLAPAADAASICRWVDENGRTQLSDAVPERYKNSASCTDAQKYDVSPVQRQAAPAPGTVANPSASN
ncbi:MAG: DUF4124 domain-containing protein, partial [Haliea sp.]